MGRLGKDYRPVWVNGVWVGVLMLAGCVAGAQARERYAGPVVVTAGICGLSASGAKQMEGYLMVRGDEVQFAPDAGVTVLRGKIDGAGHVTASATTPGADHKPFLMVFEGDLRAGRVEGHYATPRCRATVQLDRAG